MRKLKLMLACAVVAVVSAAPAGAMAGPPEHCYSPEFGDPCKPIYILCQGIDERTKGIVTCGD